jgi:hypothetical protein
VSSSRCSAVRRLRGRSQHAQQVGKIYRIGFLANDPTIPAQPAGQAFLDGLRESGFYRRTLSSSTALPRTARQRGDGGGETGKY